METSSRRTNLALIDDLLESPYKYDFHQAVIILESAVGAKLGDVPDLSQEPISLQSRVHHGVSSSEIQEIHPIKDQQYAMTINFLGLAGLQGPLPIPFTDLIIDRLRHKDTTLKDFLDIFNHRLATIWHKLFRKMGLGLSHQLPLNSPYGRSLLDLIGFETKWLRQSIVLSRRSLIHYANFLWQKPRNLNGFKRLLEGYFDLPLSLSPFQGAWLSIPKEDATKLGVLKGHYQSLGQTTLLGCRQWHQDQGLLLTIGPLSWEQYLAFLPINKKGAEKNEYLILKDLCKLYFGLGMKVLCHLVLEAVEPTFLNKKSALGYTSFLNTGVARPRESKVFNLFETNHFF